MSKYLAVVLVGNLFLYADFTLILERCERFTQHVLYTCSYQYGEISRLRPTHPNHIWAIDFVHDKLSNGRSYKMFTGLDEYTLEALCVALRPKMMRTTFWIHCTRC